MSERLLRFFLDELTTVRVVCQSPRCGAIVEIPIEKLDRSFPDGRCPICKADFDMTMPTALDSFIKAIRAVQAASDRYRIEFTLPANDQ